MYLITVCVYQHSNIQSILLYQRSTNPRRRAPGEDSSKLKMLQVASAQGPFRNCVFREQLVAGLGPSHPHHHCRVAKKKLFYCHSSSFGDLDFAEKRRELQQILKLRKLHILPKCFLFCPFQQVLQIYFQYISMIYIIYMKFTKKMLCHL